MSPKRLKLHKIVIHKDQSFSKQRSRAGKIRGGYKWQKFRKQQLFRWPLCMAPFCKSFLSGVTKASKHVHHIWPLERFPNHAFDEENCVPVCVDCHSFVEGNEKKGVKTQHWFNDWQLGNDHKVRRHEITRSEWLSRKS